MYRELMYVTEVQLEERLRYLRTRHVAIAFVDRTRDPRVVDVLERLLETVSTSEKHARYARVILTTSDENEAFDEEVSCVMSQYPILLAERRVFRTVVAEPVDLADFYGALGGAMAICEPSDFVKRTS